LYVPSGTLFIVLPPADPVPLLEYSLLSASVSVTIAPVMGSVPSVTIIDTLTLFCGTGVMLSFKKARLVASH